jgi:HK97 family phage prohead protease
MEKIYGLGEAKFKGLNEDGTFEAVISGIKTDRYGDTIDPAGWELKNFKKNPVLLWSHDHSIPAVGRALNVWVEDNLLKMKGEFAPTPFAQELKLLVEQGFLRAFSVGFMPIDYKYNDRGIDFLKQELLEASFVNVPAYVDALLKGIAEDKNKFKNFIKETEGTLNWDSLIKKDGRNEILKELKNKEVEERKIIFTEKEFEEFKKELKSGKVLSEKNRNLINSAINSMENAITPLKELLKATEADDDKRSGEDGRAKELEAKTAQAEKAKSELIKIARSAIEAYLIKNRGNK